MVEAPIAGTDTFRTGADPVRQYVLHCLAEQETPVTFDRLSTRVAALRTDSDPDAVDDAMVTEIRTALYHVHLPMLAESNFIDWDRNDQSVARGENFDEPKSLLDLVNDHADKITTGRP